MSLNLILLFAFTVFVASIIPGPSMLLALTHGMRYGAKKTLASALGNVSVTLIQASISIAGLGAFLMASETIFLFIKYAGAAYLIYMGISMLLSSDFTLSPNTIDESSNDHSAKKLFLQAALVTAGNPKAIIFFTAILPQFIDPEAGYLSQSSLLLSMCALAAFICFMIYAIGGQKIASLFSKASVAKCIKRIIGGSFIGLGISLAWSNE